MTFYFLLGLITALDIGAVVLARYYVDRKEPWVMAASLSVFAISGYVYVQLMAFAVTAVINALYAAFSAIFVTFVYYAAFKERITGGQWVGIAIALFGILMLEA